MNAPDDVLAVLADHDLPLTEIATVALAKHHDHDTGDHTRMCLLVAYAPKHVLLSREEEFRLVQSILTEEASMTTQGPPPPPGLDSTIPGYVTAVFDSEHGSHSLPQGQFLVTVDDGGDISIAYRRHSADRWMPPVTPTSHEFHPYPEEN